MTQYYLILGIGIAAVIVGVVLLCLSHRGRDEDEAVYAPMHSPFRNQGAARREDDGRKRVGAIGMISCVAGVFSFAVGLTGLFLNNMPSPVIVTRTAEDPGKIEVTMDDGGCWWGLIYYQVNQGDPVRYEEPILISPQDTLTAFTACMGWRSESVGVAPRRMAIALRAVIGANDHGDLTIWQEDIPAAGGPQKVTKTELAALAKEEFAPGSDIEIMNAKGLLRLTISAYDLDRLFDAEGADELVVTVVMEEPDDPNGVVEVALTADGREVGTALQDMVLYLNHREDDPSLVVAELVREDGFETDVAGVVPGSVADGEKIAIPLKGAAMVRVVTGDEGFEDVEASSDWAEDAVKFVGSHGIFQGSGTKSFGPKGTLTRAGAVTALYNLAGCPRTQSVDSYVDVSETDWYEKAISWATEMGIAGGTGSGRFTPGGAVTRVQFATMLWRSVGRPETTNKDLEYDGVKVNWSQNIDDAVLAWCWVTEQGIMGGKDGDTAVTRQEAAVMLRRLCAWRTGLAVG